MPSLFKKSSSDTASMSDSHRKVLHRCRMMFLKDMDVQDILDYFQPEDGFKADLKEQIMSFQTREQRVGVFLDKLEMRGDKCFSIFVEVLREHYKHLHFLVEETIRSIDDMNDTHHREKASITGEMVRKILRTNIKRKITATSQSHGSDSIDDLDVIFDEKEDDCYIDCYSIPMKGRLQKERWIKYNTRQKADVNSVGCADDNSYMAVICKDLLVKFVPPGEIPEGIPHPPDMCPAHVIDSENKYGVIKPSMYKKRESMDERRKKNLLQKDSATGGDDIDAEIDIDNIAIPVGDDSDEEAPLEPPPPHPRMKHSSNEGPPVPPKPDNLPVIGHSPSPPVLQKRNHPQMQDSKTPDSKPAPPPKGEVPLFKQVGPEKPAPVPQDVSLPLPKNESSKSLATPQKSDSSVSDLISSDDSLGRRRKISEQPKHRLSSDRLPSPPREETKTNTPIVQISQDYAGVNKPKRKTSQTNDKETRPYVNGCINEQTAEVIIEPPPRTTSMGKPASTASIDKSKSSKPKAESPPHSTEDDSLSCPPVPPRFSIGSDSGVGDDADKAGGSSGEVTPVQTQFPYNLTDADDKTPTEENAARLTVEVEDEHYEPISPVPDPEQERAAISYRESTSEERELAGNDRSSKASTESCDSFTHIPGKKEPPPRLGLLESDFPVGDAQANENVMFRNHIGKRSLPAEPDVQLPFPKAIGFDVEVLANEDDSSGTDSFYEDIDHLDDGSVKIGDHIYMDPLKTVNTVNIGPFPPNRSYSVRRMGVIREWEASGRLLLRKGDMFLVHSFVEEELPNVTTSTQYTSSSGNLSDEESSQENAESSKQDKSAISDDVFKDTVLAFDKSGRAFYIPRKYMLKHGDPRGEPWFYPIPISPIQATWFLSSVQQEGCFIVYKSTQKTNALYNLSICLKYGNVVHYHIIENIHGDVMIDGHDHSFMNVQELVEYFKLNKSQLATRLRRPLKEAKLPLTPGYHYDLKWEIPRASLKLTGKIIGKGNFGVVCGGTYKGNMPVAVKVLQKMDIKASDEDDFLEEARMLMSIKHDEIVRLIGVICKSKPYYLVTEYLRNGSLKDCLRNDVIASDNIDTLFGICIQATAALTYLESLRFMLHRDVAARNFLVADDLTVKLADFGRARYVKDDYYQAPRNEQVSVKWAAPEVLLESYYSTKSDVWSLGIVLWEIFSKGERPYLTLSSEQTIVYVTEGGRLEKPPGCAPDLFAIMRSCWLDNPEDRPSFAELDDKLKSKSSIYYTSAPAGRPVSAPVRLPHESWSNTLPSRTSTMTLPNPRHSKTLRPTTPKGKRSMTLSQDNNFEDFLMKSPLNNIKEEAGVLKSSREGLQLHGSSSETSLTSAMGMSNKDDMTRGDKIRKSLRKLVSSKPKRNRSKAERDFDRFANQNDFPYQNQARR